MPAAVTIAIGGAIMIESVIGIVIVTGMNAIIIIAAAMLPGTVIEIEKMIATEKDRQELGMVSMEMVTGGHGPGVMSGIVAIRVEEEICSR